MSGKHLLDIVNDVHDLSKIEAGRLELESQRPKVGAIVSHCVSAMRDRARGAGVEITIDNTLDLSPIRGDELRIKQVLLNLLSNSIKFTPRGGVVVSGAGVDICQLCMSDAGIGKHPEDVPIALEPFRQTDDSLLRRFEGTGLGLSLAKMLIERHGGRVESETSLGTGTTVRVSLPRCEPPRPVAGR